MGIIEFPKDRIVRENPEYNNDRIAEIKEKGNRNFAEYIVEDITTIIVTELSNYGVDVEDEIFLKDISLSVDAFRASVYRTLGLPHQLHKLIDDELIEIVEPEGKVVE